MNLKYLYPDQIQKCLMTMQTLLTMTPSLYLTLNPFSLRHRVFRCQKLCKLQISLRSTSRQNLQQLQKGNPEVCQEEGAQPEITREIFLRMAGWSLHISKLRLKPLLTPQKAWLVILKPLTRKGKAMPHRCLLLTFWSYNSFRLSPTTDYSPFRSADKRN